MFKGLFRSLCSLLIVFSIFTMLFSTVSFQDLAGSVYEDIYKYANKDKQEEILAMVINNCQLLASQEMNIPSQDDMIRFCSDKENLRNQCKLLEDQNYETNICEMDLAHTCANLPQDFDAISQACVGFDRTNYESTCTQIEEQCRTSCPPEMVSLLQNCRINPDSIEESCSAIAGMNKKQYNSLVIQCENIGAIENFCSSDIKESCSMVLSDSFDRNCEMFTTIELDVEGMKKGCNDILNGNFREEKIFSKMMNSLVGEIQLDNKMLGFMQNKFRYPVLITAIVLLLLLLYPLNESNATLYFNHIGSIAIRTGIVLLLPVLLLQVYMAASPPDTTFILESINEEPSGDFIQDAVMKILPSVFLKIFSRFIYYSIGFLVVGSIIWIVTRQKQDKVEIDDFKNRQGINI